MIGATWRKNPKRGSSLEAFFKIQDGDMLGFVYDDLNDWRCDDELGGESDAG